MKLRVAALLPVFLLSGLALANQAPDLTDMRLLRMPDIHADQVVFVHAGDLWTVSAQGGEARRLTSHVGNEWNPKFSPDGRFIAFSGDYDGNVDCYVIPAVGGEPRRLTFHPARDRVIDWQPDGKSIRFQSSRNIHDANNLQLWTVPVDGGFPEMMALPEAGLSSYSPDGNRLVFNRITREQRTWKRYKGGMAQDLWLYDFERNHSERLTDWVGTDNFPMWHGDTIYFTSDRQDGKLQIWALDPGTGQERRITTHEEYDVKYPSLGPDAIVYENGGWLYVMDLPGEQTHKLSVSLHDDRIHARESLRPVADLILSADLAPDGKRAVFAARGEIFTVPAEKGSVRNLTRTPGIRERDCAWSPDGKLVAYFSDRHGEYRIALRPGDGKGEEKFLTGDLKSWPSGLVWSPDSKKLLLRNAALGLFTVQADGGKLTEIARSTQSAISDFDWSPDSRWVAYTMTGENQFSSLFLHDTETGESRQVTTEFTSEGNPAFDPEGKYLFFTSRRHFNPTIGDMDLKPIYTHQDGLYLVTLQADAEHPFAPESDEVEVCEDMEEDKAEKDADAEDEEEKETVTQIDLEGIGGRIIPLDVPPGNYFALEAAAGKLFYLSSPTRPGEPAPPSLMVFLMEDREAKPVLEKTDGYTLSAGKEKLLYSADGQWGIVEAAAEQSPAEQPLRTGEMMARVVPAEEWPQLFLDGWRLERDFFYDPELHQVNWDRMYERYGQLVPYVSHRSDLDYLLGEMIAELSCSHAYVRATGDYPEIPRLATGLLGCDLELDARSKHYRFGEILTERDWNGGSRAPLAEPGLNVNPGDYLLSIDGVPLTPMVNPYFLLENKVDQPVVLEVSAKADGKDSREITVRPIGSERNLRYTAWVKECHRRVEELSGGKIGYLHLPNTAIGGMQAFAEGYYPQMLKQGLIVDERFNGGGFVPDFMMTILRQKLIHLWQPRYGKAARVPGTTFLGHLAMLTNEMAGSGGDALPYYFKNYQLGPVVGTRSWGGLVGYMRRIPLMDGGWLTFPEFGVFSLDGEFVVENHGVDPDIVVDNLPHEVIAGRDPQLERAVEYLLKKIKEEPVPEYEAGPFPRDRN